MLEIFQDKLIIRYKFKPIKNYRFLKQVDMIVGLFLINFMEINKLFKFKWLKIKEIGNYTFTIKNQVKKN